MFLPFVSSLHSVICSLSSPSSCLWVKQYGSRDRRTPLLSHTPFMSLRLTLTTTLRAQADEQLTGMTNRRVGACQRRNAGRRAGRQREPHMGGVGAALDAGAGATLWRHASPHLSPALLSACTPRASGAGTNRFWAGDASHTLLPQRLPFLPSPTSIARSCRRRGGRAGRSWKQADDCWFAGGRGIPPCAPSWRVAWNGTSKAYVQLPSNSPCMYSY